MGISVQTHAEETSVSSQVETVNDSVLVTIEIVSKDIDAEVGETGQLEVGDFNGIALKGTFSEVTDNPNIKVNSDGTWEALKVGKTRISSVFTLSEATFKEIEAKYPGKEVAIQENLRIVLVNVTEPKTEAINITLEPKENEINAKTGDTGKLSLGNYKDIELIGVYTEIKDNPYIELNKNGEWKAISPGETSFEASVKLSEETIAKLEKAYPGKEIIYSTKAPKVIKVTISKSETKKEPIALDITISPGSIDAKVGETGQLKVKDFEGIALKGTFLEIADNPNIELKADGSWKALKAGKTTIAPMFTLSEETIAEIKAKYPDREIAIKASQQLISVNVTEKATTPTETPKSSGKVAVPVNKTLPQTSEKIGTSYLVALGSSLIFLVALLFRKLKSPNKY